MGGQKNGDKFGTTISDEDFAEYEGCDKPTWFVSVTSMISIVSLYILGHVRDLFGQYFGKSRYSDSFAKPPTVRRIFASIFLPVLICVILRLYFLTSSTTFRRFINLGNVSTSKQI